jgi:hypothetical protein
VWGGEQLKLRDRARESPIGKERELKREREREGEREGERPVPDWTPRSYFDS